MTAGAEIPALLGRLGDGVAALARRVEQGTDVDFGPIEADLQRLRALLAEEGAGPSPHLPAMVALLDDMERVRRATETTRDHVKQQLSDMNRGRRAAAAYRGDGAR